MRKELRRGFGCGVWTLLVLLVVWPAGAALPKRLVIAIDGIAYRDMKALQQGITYRDQSGKFTYRRAFQDGYFPVSRNVSTFPSASDVAWTDILRNRPVPGYQRTYYSAEANTTIAVNGLTTPIEFEKQMSWKVRSGYRRAMSFLYPVPAYEYEIDQIIRAFMRSDTEDDTFYGLVNSTDDAQHMGQDILAMLCTLDLRLTQLRDFYRAREGRDLEVVLISDHGNNHTGPPRRVLVRRCLETAGYSIGNSIRRPQDVVLPTVGMQSWVEVQNLPEDTERLVSLLSGLEGVDIVTARAPGQTNRFWVVSGTGERAIIDWDTARNAFRYGAEKGDPINYQPVVAALARKGDLDSAGFAPADAWMRETLEHRYPVALERIARGHTTVTLNPAPILVSLVNGYVHCSWFVKNGSELTKTGGTHGALDDVNSVGMILSNFQPTHDTTSARVAAQFGNFGGRTDFRSHERGGEWVRSPVTRLPPARPVGGDLERTGYGGGEAIYRVAHNPSPAMMLRMWSPDLKELPQDTPVEIRISEVPRFWTGQTRHNEPKAAAAEERIVLTRTTTLKAAAYDRMYEVPSGLPLKPQKQYRAIGTINRHGVPVEVSRFTFHTDQQGLPLGY